MRGLVISWFYPPGNSSEGLVTYKLLSNSSFEYDVFTRKTHNADMFDRQTNETSLVSDNVEVFQATTNDPELWIGEAVDFFERNIQKYDFIMTRCMTAAAHDAGAKIKARHQDILWLASFGDPLINTPYLRDDPKNANPFLFGKYCIYQHVPLKDMARVYFSKTRRAQRKLWEAQRLLDTKYSNYCSRINQSTFRGADKLIFNNTHQFNHAFTGKNKQYRSKGMIINHTFDKKLYPTIKPPVDNKIHFVYVGHLDALRNANSLLQSIHKLHQNDPQVYKKVCFEFYGHIDDSDKVYILDHDLINIVRLHPDVDYITSLSRIANADWTILIDANLNNKIADYIFCPAKLIDYIGVKKKVFAITQPSGATTDIINSVGCGQAVSHSPEEIYLYLSKIIYQKYNPIVYNDNKLMEYEAEKVARDFDTAVQKILNDRRIDGR